MKQKHFLPCHERTVLSAFGLLTTLVLLVDVRPVGPGGSAVGLASLNLFVLQCLGGSPFWYRLTEALGLTAILCAAGFALLGLLQLLQRRSFRQVDRRLRYMGGFYALVLAVYLLFEALPVSFRPILVNGKLEASYPSSHTVLVLCVMGTALLYLHSMEEMPHPPSVRRPASWQWFSQSWGGYCLGCTGAPM